MTTRKPQQQPRGRPIPASVRQQVIGLGELVEIQNAAYEDAFALELRRGGDDEAGHEAGTRAWKASLPLLASRAAIQMYIAAIAHGMSRGYLTAEQARVMLYGAQMSLAAHGREKQP